MSFWSSALDHLLDDSMAFPQPNPFPPVGSGKKPRPALLYVPDFDPPPPTPSPLFLFQLPAKLAAKPAWNPPQERKRRLKVWDMMPELPPAMEPQQRLKEPSQRCQLPAGHQGSLIAAPPMNGHSRQLMLADLAAAGSKCSPTTADILRQVMGYEPGFRPTFNSQRAQAQRRSREGFQCGVDLSALWNVVLDFVFSPTQEKAGPSCSALEEARLGSVHVPQQLEAARCSPDDEIVSFVPQFSKGSRVEASRQGGKSLYPHLLQDARKGVHSSPMSVLSPLGGDKSSADSSPCPSSLLAFVERNPSPFKL